MMPSQVDPHAEPEERAVEAQLRPSTLREFEGQPRVSDQLGLVLEAARRGTGMALAWQNLIEDDLASGRLVKPLAEQVHTRFGYHLAWPRSRPQSWQAASFINWVLERYGIGKATSAP